MRCCPKIYGLLGVVVATAALAPWTLGSESPTGTPVGAATPPASLAPEQVAPTALRAGSAAAAPDARAAAAFPPEFYRTYPPGTRIAMRLPEVRSGIALGGGRFLPPLNGVSVADGIPPVKRDRRLPPPGPVVAKIVDLRGQEWWLHEDGSQTSCSFASVTKADGAVQRIVSTQHGAPRPGGGHGTLGSSTGADQSK